MTFEIPEGFEPVLFYPQGKEPGVPMKDRIKLPGAGPRGLTFSVKEGVEAVPVLPLIGHGELWHRGWDIPSRWAIDAKKRCFIDNAHGHPLDQVTSRQLLGECEEEVDTNHIKALLGLPLDPPEWQKAALVAGWTPPKEKT